MKLRNGFVSNSSSSSYIISIPRILTIDQLYIMIQDETAGWENLKDLDYESKEHKFDVMYKVKKALEENHIEVNVDNAGRIDIIGFTCMHNDYRTMPKMLQDIYFKLMEELPGSVVFKREEFA